MKIKNSWALIISTLSLPIFWFFREKMYLLGDGYFRLRDLPMGKLYPQEWLDGFIHLGVYRLFNWSPEFTYSIISVLCGAVFIFLSLKLSDLIGRNKPEKVLIFSSLVLLGSIQLFFGYVESYSILQVIVLLYAYLGFLYLQGKVSHFWILSTFLVGMLLNITFLIFMPSLIYLFWKRKRWLILMVVMSCFWLDTVISDMAGTGKGMFLVPLYSTWNYPFSLFSLTHVSEFVNQLLLVCPLAILLIMIFWTPSKDRFINFLSIGVLFGLLSLFMVNYILGSADWDARSLSAPFIGLLGGMVFLNWARNHKVAIKGWVMIFVLFGIFHVTPWILVNSSRDKSVERYVMVQENDQHPQDRTNYNTFKVARILLWAGLKEEAIGLFKRAADRHPGDPRNYNNLRILHEAN